MTYGLTLFLTKYGTLAKEREKETATWAGLGHTGKGVAVRNVQQRGRMRGMGTDGWDDDSWRRGGTPRNRRAPDEGSPERSYGRGLRESARSADGWNPPRNSRNDASGQGSRYGRRPGGGDDGSSSGYGGRGRPAGPGDRREVARARPEKTTMTTTARADVALLLPTAQDVRAPRRAPTPGMRHSSVDGVRRALAVRAVRAASGMTMAGQGACAPASAIPVGACLGATIRAILVRGGQVRQRQPRSPVASHLARRSALSC